MLQASIASKHQMLLGSCLTAHASGASPSLGELPLRVHHVVRNGLTSTSTSMWCLSITACAEAFICWEQAALILFFAAARILGRPCLHPLHASPGLSSSCLRLVSILGVHLYYTPGFPGKNGALDTHFFPPNVFSSL